MTPPKRTIQLAACILQHTTNIETYLAENSLPSPSFAPGTPLKLSLTPALEESLAATLSAIDELNALLLGPLGWLVAQIGHAYDLVSMHALHRFKVPSLIPESGSIPISELTARIPTTSPDVLSRLLDHAVGNYLLIRPQPGHIEHSAVSAMIAASPEVQDWLGSACEDMWPAASHVVPALVKWPGSVEPHHTGHNLAERTEVPFFTTLSKDQDRMRRFASAMSVMKNVPGFQPSAALEGYDLAAFGEATVVDVGGSKGDFALALTELHPNISVIVQDVPSVVEEGRKMLTERPGLALTFQEHDFFETQPVKNADAYFLRMILHDWPDERCLCILRGLVPALKPGARILINDRCVPSSEGMSNYETRQTRCQDLAMLAVFNSKERSEAEWRGLVARADSRFRFESIVQLMASPLAIMEISWNPLDKSRT